MDRFPKKPCRFCGGMGHFPYLCLLNPKRKKAFTKKGKIAKQWDVTRKTWIRQNPPDNNGFWVCYLQITPKCPVYLNKNMLTLDHIVARSRDPSKRFNKDNIKPACWGCNVKKGSRSLDDVL